MYRLLSRPHTFPCHREQPPLSRSSPGAASSLSSRNASSRRSMLMWWKSAVNLSFFLSLATLRMRSSLPFPCDFPYALQRLWHAYPVLRPAHALLARISLGLRPWLHRLRRSWLRSGLLRSGLLRFVRRLLSYYDGVPTSRARASSATAPRLPDADHPSHSTLTASHEISQLPTRSSCYTVRALPNTLRGLSADAAVISTYPGCQP